MFNSLSSSGQSIVGGMVYTGLTQSITAYNRGVNGAANTFLRRQGRHILESVGLNSNKLGIVGTIARNVVLNGVNSAGELAQHIIAGNLNIHTLPNFSNYGLNTMLSGSNGIDGSIARNINSMHDLVGASITDAVSGGSNGVNYLTTTAYSALSELGLSDVPFTSNFSRKVDDHTLVSSTSYAQRFSLGGYTPKLKYLYAVKFNFNDRSINDSFTFLIKKFDRPKITIEHDQVSMYNFRTDVPKRTLYNPLTLDIHDDANSSAMNFFVGYLRRISPLFSTTTSAEFESNGMNFVKSSGSYGLHSVSGEDVVLIKSIEVFHMYNNFSHMDKYTYHRPKVTNFTLDGLDMEDGTTGNQITLEFAYDGLNIDVAQTADGVSKTFEEAIYGHSFGVNKKGADKGSALDASLRNLLTTTTTSAITTPIPGTSALDSITNNALNPASFKAALTRGFNMDAIIPADILNKPGDILHSVVDTPINQKISAGYDMVNNLLAKKI
jgi:hypothetical protein